MGKTEPLETKIDKCVFRRIVELVQETDNNSFYIKSLKEQCATCIGYNSKCEHYMNALDYQMLTKFTK